MPAVMTANDKDSQKWIPPGEIMILGSAKYVGAPSTHCEAAIGIVNGEYLALIFPAAHGVQIALRIPYEQRTPSQKFAVDTHLNEPLKDSVHVPFMAAIAGEFDESLDAVLDEWKVFSGYTHVQSDSDPVHRVYAFCPPEDWYRPKMEYIRPLLTRLRERGPDLSLEFHQSGA